MSQPVQDQDSREEVKERDRPVGERSAQRAQEASRQWLRLARRQRRACGWGELCRSAGRPVYPRVTEDQDRKNDSGLFGEDREAEKNAGKGHPNSGIAIARFQVTEKGREKKYGEQRFGSARNPGDYLRMDGMNTEDQGAHRSD